MQLVCEGHWGCRHLVQLDHGAAAGLAERMWLHAGDAAIALTSKAFAVPDRDLCPILRELFLANDTLGVSIACLNAKDDA